MHIEGIDLGYTYVKTASGIMFPSMVSTEERILKDSTELEMGGRKYFIGVGNVITELNKVDNQATKALLVTALALSSLDCEFSVVTGLPISQYHAQKEAMKNLLLSITGEMITINGIKRYIAVKNAEVFPQSAGAFYTLEAKDLEPGMYMVIDWGGRTVDVSLWEITKEKKRKLNRYRTITEGSLSLCSKLTNILNAQYDLDLSVEDGEEIINNGYIEILGDIVSVEDAINKLMEEQLDRVFKDLHLDFPVKVSRHFLCGGGGVLYRDKYNRRVPCKLINDSILVKPNGTRIHNSQLANAIGFAVIGYNLWERKE